MRTQKFTRRRALQGLSLLAAGGATGLLAGRKGQAAPNDDGPRFLIVLCATGGASIIDSTLAIRESESANASTLNCFPDALVTNPADSPFRAVDLETEALASIPVPVSANQSGFVAKHHRDMMVSTFTTTSVNHAVAQRRALTGNEAWHGRTLQEAVAQAFGAGFALPNVHLTTGTGFTEHGTDRSLPSWCFGEMVSDPSLWPLALDGQRGIAHPVKPDELAKARALRNDWLDPGSKFDAAFGRSTRLERWKQIRGDTQAKIEDADLIRKLMLFPDSEAYPFGQHGLESSPAGQQVHEVFPNYATDPLHAQAALAFLLLKYRVSVSVTLGPSFDLTLSGDFEINSGSLPEGAVANPPLAFDFSHQGHRSSQAFMWDRIYTVADGLISLLKAEQWDDGQSMWDRSLIYVASDFGRTKNRPANAPDFGTGHDLNNGALVISPLANGNRVLGGVDPDTGLTYGFDPQSGAPEPGRQMTEPEIYSGILHALGVDTGGALPDMAAMRKA